ncbi:hypothetical protein GOV07_04095 [Candidatus Woesearchaeota archaeon]|nr:hypothetical protein [Candidatus Woesearchaeota archaeon]
MGDDPEFEEWQRERDMRRKISIEGPDTVNLSEPPQENVAPTEEPKPSPQKPKSDNKLLRYLLKGVIVFALLRRVFMNAIASAESPSAYGAPTVANHADSIVIILILILYFTKKKHLAGILLGVYASLLLIGSLIGFGIDANGKVWMMISAVIVLVALVLMKHLEGDPDPQEISNEDVERLKQDPVRRF